MPGSSKCFLSCLFIESLYAAFLSSYVPHILPVSLSVFYYPSIIWCRVQIMKFLRMQFSHVSCYLLRPKYIFQHRILEHPLPLSSCNVSASFILGRIIGLRILTCRSYICNYLPHYLWGKTMWFRDFGSLSDFTGQVGIGITL
jgi:hypothetical protein